MNDYRLWLVLLFLLLPLHLTGAASPFFPNNSPSTEEPYEVFLSFNYKNLFNNVVIAYYDEGDYYLPVSQIFSLLKIKHAVSSSPPAVSGSFLDANNTFYLDFETLTISLKEKGEFSIEQVDLILGETDYYLESSIFNEVFGLNFTVDFNNLVLHLESENELPVYSQYLRKERRQKTNRYSITREYYDLKFYRERKIVAGGFLDYSLTTHISEDDLLYAYSTNIGGEILGGDVQGSINGNFSKENSNFLTNNLRWRYVDQNNPYFSQIFAGQSSTEGLYSRAITGIRITNDPIVPRFIFDEVEIQGAVEPGSEVELYFNDALYDFQNVNQDGKYRFIAPLTFGTSRLRLQIYDPAGSMRQQLKNIQIPYRFLPPGKTIYNASLGRLDSPILGALSDNYLAQGEVGYGINNWLTQKLGAEYITDTELRRSTLLYSSTSLRISQGYLVNLDIAPAAFYRFSTSSILPSSASWDIDYSYYTASEHIYNNLDLDQELNASFYLPVQLFKNDVNLRFTTNSISRGDYYRNRYNIDLNSRINRFNVRFNYSDTKIKTFSLSPSNAAELSSSLSYFVPKTSPLPKALHGFLFRGEIAFNPSSNELTGVRSLIAKDFLADGRIQVSYAKNLISDYTFFNVGLSFDLDRVRSSSSAIHSARGSGFKQNFLGSVGFDPHNSKFILSNRRQVNQAGAAVKLFVDNNNNERFDEEDTVIKDNAIRIGRSGKSRFTSDGTIYISQLQAYHQVNLEINKGALRNPLIVPQFEQFSFIAPPNQYKRIEIPFYTSGVISGNVKRIYNGKQKGIAGLRMYLVPQTDSVTSTELETKQIPTFSDGSFYAYEIRPGKYYLFPDPNQLDFLNMISKPDSMDIEIEALAQGDFVEGLNFKLEDRTLQNQPALNQNIETKDIGAPGNEKQRKDNSGTTLSIGYNISVDSLQTTECNYHLQYGGYDTPGQALAIIQTDSNNVYYNNQSKQYFSWENSFSTLGNTAHHIRNNGLNTASVVEQCNTFTPASPSEEDLANEAYFLQYGAFKNQSDANTLKRQLNNLHGIRTHVTADPENNFYKVRSAPFPSREEANNQKEEILSSTSLAEDGIFLTKGSITSGIQSFNPSYQLQLGLFESTRKATLYAIRLDEVFNLRSRVVIDQNQQVLLYIEQDFSRWEEAASVQKAISGDESFQPPIIHTTIK
ncbi:MAG: hypothetical protein FH748_14545 [Balneolaceae bacterium]|nr:hypothetical protein [Balneolaceae bacterium]